jgi:predicted negative regulator of RcsB-dependent stress response
MDSKVEQLPVSDRFWAWYETNKNQALVGAIVVVVLGIGIGFYVWNTSQKDVAAGEAVTRIAWTVLTSPTGARPGTAEAYLKAASEYKNSMPGGRALLEAAATFFVDQQYDRARGEFERYLREYRESPLLGEALLGVAACHDAQNRTNDAITAYRNLVTQHPSDPVVPQAQFALGRLYEAQGQLEQARDSFEKAAQASLPNSSVGSESWMRLEELKRKLPPPPVQPTASAQPFTLPPPSAPKPTATPPPPTSSSTSSPAAKNP